MPNRTIIVPLDKIVIDREFYARIVPDWYVINKYKDALLAGAKFPPILVALDGDHYISLDGWHTREAAKRAGKTSFPCEVTSEPRSRWLEIAVTRNAAHGEPMSTNVKVHNITRLRALGYSWDKIGVVMYMPAPVVKRILAGRVLPPGKGAHGPKGVGSPISAPLVGANTRGVDPDRIADAQMGVAGHDQVQILHSAAALFLPGMLDAENDAVLKAATNLAAAVQAWAAPVRTATRRGRTGARA